jgi:hypothetical protein
MLVNAIEIYALNVELMLLSNISALASKIRFKIHFLLYFDWIVCAARLGPVLNSLAVHDA